MKTLILVVALAAAVTVSSANAAAIGYTLTLTEFSSASLTALYSGPSSTTFSVSPNSPDNWTVSYSSANNSLLLDPFVWDWEEPEEPNEFNEVAHGIDFGSLNNLYVTSDESLEEYAGNFSTILDNNTATPVKIGTDGGVPVYLVFNDLAQQSETGTGVPDGGSTLGLLALSAAALFGMSRLRHLRFA